MAAELLEAVEDVSLDVARAALRRLRRVAGSVEVAHLRRRLLELDIGIVGEAAATLRELDDSAAAAVCVAELSRDSPTRRHKAAIALRELRASTARTPLLHALEDEAAPVRRVSVEALERLPADAMSVTAVRRALADPDPSVRAAAVRALAQFDPDAAQTLVVAAADEARVVREAVAGAACILHRGTVSALLDDEAADVRMAVLKALVDCAGAARVARLVACFADESWHVRRVACDTIAAAGGEEASRALVRALLDPHLEVRGRALVALERLHAGDLEFVLERSLARADGELRRRLIELLGRRGRGEVALGYLSDPAPEIRIAVAHALARVSSPEARQALDVLARDDDASVRNAAAVASDPRPR